VYSFEKEGKQQLMQVRIHVDGARATNKFVHAEVVFTRKASGRLGKSGFMSMKQA
jgi:hypothetical protein